VKLVDCGRENIKLTTPADIPAAEAILAARREKEKKS
jgi:2-C-methyl-D-erythritol 4-phosphate cytidylyltransferase